MATEDELRELLPKMRFNKEFKKKKRYEFKKRVEAREKEREIVTGKKRSDRKQKDGGKDGAEAPTVKPGKVAAPQKGAAAKAAAKGGAKTRVPKLKVADAETGKETLKKKKARELVAAKKKEKRKAASAKKAPAAAAKSAARRGTAAVAGTPTAVVAPAPAAKVREEKVVRTTGPSAPVVVARPPLSQAEEDRELLARAIRGDALLAGDATGDAPSTAFIHRDPSLYPNHAFLDEYAEKKRADAVSADELLQNAHHFFKDLRQREQALTKVAKEHIKRLRAVNRRGGDEEGFRYVVPKNVKRVVRDLLSAQKARNGEDDPDALIDPDTLVSTFGGDGVAETSDKPMRRKRRQRSNAYKDFYQFQVSQRWTRNAENFLKRSRSHKMLFEAKKHQRSIKKF
ncbi:hypothetical protein NESM_000502900 [Novymonas esmeraldas]|uniref:Ribosomal RNA-processing protein 7 C-terminal domain-containing protein n=1 Tax=Novymonas esmeraldas TaxID=1808958 RepID=A0AAW0EQC7_9TRYP